MKERLIFIVGPTAVGKTRAASILARKINAEIISCDSMQIYKGMNIITSKAPATLRKMIPHHLIDLISPDREYNVSRYRRQAVKKIKEILGRNRLPLLVGGTGLYVSSLVDGIFELKSENKSLRKRLYKQAQDKGSSSLHRRLEKIDPEAALKIHPNDTRRIVRALEVYECTGKPISSLQKQRKGLRDEYEVRIFCLNMGQAALNKKIDERVEGMFEEGLIPEVKKLLESKLSKTARYAIGIPELKGYFEGIYGLDEAKQLIKRNTRLYAKRQLTWFRKDKRIKWIRVGRKKSAERIADKIWRELS